MSDPQKFPFRYQHRVIKRSLSCQSLAAARPTRVHECKQVRQYPLPKATLVPAWNISQTTITCRSSVRLEHSEAENGRLRQSKSPTQCSPTDRESCTHHQSQNPGLHGGEPKALEFAAFTYKVFDSQRDPLVQESTRSAHVGCNSAGRKSNLTDKEGRRRSAS